MSLLAPTLEAFFTERLAGQREASPHTVAAYRDTLRLLLGFLYQSTGKAPSQLDFDDLGAARIGSFLDYLEQERGVSASTRNARLAAIRSLFRFAALRHPEHAALIHRVLAIPSKRYDRALVTFLNREEIDALLTSPDRETWIGRRDHALLTVAIQTGLRVSELVSLRRADLDLRAGAHVRCLGKGRKERCTPITKHTVAVLRVWLAERRGGPSDPLFPGPSGARLGRHAVSRLVSKYASIAAVSCPSIAKKRVSPHILRHTNAMQLRQSGADSLSIALWLGHESPRTTQIYLHSDLTMKERTIARTAPPGTKPGRYRPTDALLAFLAGL